jgi:hypothetical protein
MLETNSSKGRFARADGYGGAVDDKATSGRLIERHERAILACRINLRLVGYLREKCPP